MSLRTQRESVTFRAPFSIPGLDDLQPAGTYTIETEDELLEPLSFTAYHRVSTSIVLPLGRNSYQIVKIDPGDLAAAQRRDADSAAPGKEAQQRTNCMKPKRRSAVAGRTTRG